MDEIEALEKEFLEDTKQEDKLGVKTYSGDKNPDRESIVAKLFDVRKWIIDQYLSIRGFITTPKGKIIRKNELAGEEFASKFRSVMTSYVSSIGALSKNNDTELNIIKRRNARVILFDGLDEETVDDNDLESLSVQSRNMLDMFGSVTYNGHGADLLKDTMAGINTRDPLPETKKAGWLD